MFFALKYIYYCEKPNFKEKFFRTTQALEVEAGYSIAPRANKVETSIQSSMYESSARLRNSQFALELLYQVFWCRLFFPVSPKPLRVAAQNFQDL